MFCVFTNFITKYYIEMINCIVNVVTLCVLFRGLNVFNKKRKDARFGYYSIMANFIKRIKFSLSIREDIFFRLSPMYRKTLDYQLYERIEKGIIDVGQKFLDYLCTEQNQVSPKNANDWQEKIHSLIERLNELVFYFGCKIPIDHLRSEDDIKKYRDEIFELIDFFENNLKKY